MWRLEASWWDEGELRKDPRFSYSPKVAGFHDYVAEITLDEARELADKYRRKAFPWQRNEADSLRLRLEALGGHVNVVRVLVFEWGSEKDAPRERRPHSRH